MGPARGIPVPTKEQQACVPTLRAPLDREGWPRCRFLHRSLLQPLKAQEGTELERVQQSQGQKQESVFRLLVPGCRPLEM